MRVYSYVRRWLDLDKPIGGGGEADVHPVRGLPDLLAKVYHPAERPPHLEFLLDVVRSSAEGVPGACPMFEPVHERPGGAAAGYLMARVSGVPLSKAAFSTADHRIDFALRLVTTAHELERNDLYFGDGHPENVFQDTGGRPVLIDVDSCSFPEVLWPDGTKGPRNFPKGTVEWSPPELLGNPNVQRGPHTVAHGLALLVHRVLKDRHPAEVADLDGRPVPLDQCVLALSFGRFDPSLRNRTVPDLGIPYESLPDQVHWLFAQAFTRGLRDPLNRPLSGEYVRALSRWQRARRGKQLAAVACGALAAALALRAAVAGGRGEAPAGPRPAASQAQQPDRPAIWNKLGEQR